MNTKVLIVALSLIIITACSKDKFETKPKLSFESINGTEFFAGQTISIKLRLSDKEGDFKADDSAGNGYTKPYLYYKRISYVCPDGPNGIDTSTSLYNVPVFPTNKFLDAFIDINYTYAVQGQYPTLNGCTSGTGGIDDSSYFKIWIKDEAGHVSDTVSTPAIKLIKN